MSWVVPALAGVLGLAFAAVVARRWHARRRAHDLAWTLGLAAYGAASLLEAWVAVHGWSAPLYRLYFPLVAGLVGLLAAGTLYVAFRDPRVGHAAVALTVGGLLVAGAAQFLTPFDPASPFTAIVDGESVTRSADEWRESLGSKAVPFTNPARWANLLLNVAGGVVLVGGALLSGLRTRRPGVLLIAVGALLPFLGGGLSTLGALDARITLQFLGILVMFTGYLAGTRAAPAAAASPSGAGEVLP